jgi:hypothetical protein
LPISSHPDLSQSTSALNEITFFGLSDKLYLQLLQLIVSSKRLDLFGENRGLNEFDGVTHLLATPEYLMYMVHHDKPANKT